MKSRKRILAILPMIFLVAVLLSGCRLNISICIDDYLTGAFTYEADKMERIEIYWRSGEVEIVESDSAELSVRESGTVFAYTASSADFIQRGLLREKVICMFSAREKARLQSAVPAATWKFGKNCGRKSPGCLCVGKSEGLFADTVPQRVNLTAFSGAQAEALPPQRAIG